MPSPHIHLHVCFLLQVMYLLCLGAGLPSDLVPDVFCSSSSSFCSSTEHKHFRARFGSNSLHSDASDLAPTQNHSLHFVLTRRQAAHISCQPDSHSCLPLKNPQSLTKGEDKPPGEKVSKLSRERKKPLRAFTSPWHPEPCSKPRLSIRILEMD